MHWWISISPWPILTPNCRLCEDREVVPPVVPALPSTGPEASQRWCLLARRLDLDRWGHWCLMMSRPMRWAWHSAPWHKQRKEMCLSVLFRRRKSRKSRKSERCDNGQGSGSWWHGNLFMIGSIFSNFLECFMSKVDLFCLDGDCAGYCWSGISPSTRFFLVSNDSFRTAQPLRSMRFMFSWRLVGGAQFSCDFTNGTIALYVYGNGGGMPQLRDLSSSGAFWWCAFSSVTWLSWSNGEWGAKGTERNSKDLLIFTSQHVFFWIPQMSHSHFISRVLSRAMSRVSFWNECRGEGMLRCKWNWWNWTCFRAFETATDQRHWEIQCQKVGKTVRTTALFCFRSLLVYCVDFAGHSAAISWSAVAFHCSYGSVHIGWRVILLCRGP